MTLSKEKLAHYAAHTEGPVKAMARELLERRERDVQEPVAWIVHARTGDQLTQDGGYVANAEGMAGIGSTPLYAAPPAPVVSEELLTSMEEVLRISDRQHDAWCKAKAAIATLRAAPQLFGNAEQLEPVSQRCKLVGEVVAWDHPNKERSVDFRWLNYDVAPGTKLYAMGKE